VHVCMDTSNPFRLLPPVLSEGLQHCDKQHSRSSLPQVYKQLPVGTVLVTRTSGAGRKLIQNKHMNL
jgi:hypothetical protein